MPEVMERVEWVGGPYCGGAFLAPIGTTHISVEDDGADWEVPIMEHRAIWRYKAPNEEDTP